MKYDWEQYKKGEGNNYNDSERLMSYSVAWELFKQRPLLGTGIGDLKTEMKEGHLAQFGSKEKYIYPHNQYLFLLSGIGIVLTLLFLLGLYAPLAAALNNPFLWLIFTILSLAFLVENTIQRAVSTAFFTFFILLNYRLSSAEKE